MTRKVARINHLAIIPDGNRRWAKQMMILEEEMVYQKGADRIKEIMEAVFKLDVKHVTFWTSSLANITERAGRFREVMNSFYTKKFNDLAENQIIMEKEVKIQVFGEWEKNLGEIAVRSIANAIEKTDKNKKRFLSILIGYDGKRERGAATIKLMRDIMDGMITPPESIENAEFKLRKCAWTGALPSVDLIIRTGSWKDPHLSADFLTFLTGDSQLAFPDVFWPDFSTKELQKILLDYRKRERRYGK